MTTAQPNDPTTMVGDMLASASPDLLRSMLSTFIQTLMGAEADALCGAGYGERSPDRVNSRNGYRHRDFDTRVGTLDVAVPKPAVRVVLPGLASRAAHPRRTRPGVGRGDLLPAGGVDPTGGKAGPGARRDVAVQVAGVDHGP